MEGMVLFLKKIFFHGAPFVLSHFFFFFYLMHGIKGGKTHFKKEKISKKEEFIRYAHKLNDMRAGGQGTTCVRETKIQR